MTLRIILGDGRRVRDPATGQALTKHPRDVPDTAFWRRRLADGDVVIPPAQPPRQPPAPPKPPAAPGVSSPTPRSSSAKRGSAQKDS